MTKATLLLREEASTSLSGLVEKSQRIQNHPLPEYELQVNTTQLELTLRSKPESHDEGFESDIDSLSLVSSEGSFTPEGKTTETDSANGSASSDSDTETNEPIRTYPKESFYLVECLCYTDVKFNNVLVFVIKQEALVFRLNNLKTLRNFYLNFTALKALSSQKNYVKKFNLLQRTDSDGVTHIEITREPENRFIFAPNERSDIISLKTPEIHTLNRRKENVSSPKEDKSLRKVWNSAEDLLDTPKRPQRRRKQKGRAPSPPLPSNILPDDVFRGECVRVNVTNTQNQKFIAKSHNNTKNNLVTLLSKPKINPSWTNSVPKLVKNQRSRSETRYFTPRYIDTTPNYSPMGSRLFGFSSKLRDFTSEGETRWGAVSELSYKQEGNLKSVIKKDENKKKNEKKVTFSAYTTVQVV